MKKRFYSCHYFGARETTGDNPVMRPEVTMELVKRLNGIPIKSTSSVWGSFCRIMALVNVCGVMINMIVAFERNAIAGIIGATINGIALIYFLFLIDEDNKSNTPKISVPPLG